MWKFFVKQQKIEIMEREVIADYQIAFVNLKFVFDSEWKKFHKVVQFTQYDETYNRVLGLDNTSCLLPSELHAGTVKMSVFGYDPEADKGIRATTVPITLNIRPSGFVSDGTEEVPPSPDLYTQLLQRFEEKASSLQNGINGKDGQNGKSTYDIWLTLGNSGTETDFLNSLKGETGSQGIQGENGRSAYEIWLELGNSGTESEFLNSLKGNTGQNGISPLVSFDEQEDGILMSVTDAESTKTALIKHGNTDLTPYATKDEVGQQIQDITNVLNTNAGEIVTEKICAEIFNDYENNKAIGDYSHAEGSMTTARGKYSHAEGYDTVAHKEYSHAEGYNTFAQGLTSHAEGANTTASGLVSHAEGFGTIAKGRNSHAMGKYNIEDTEDKYAFIIGNGESGEARSNAFAIDWEGNIYIGNSNVPINLLDLLARIEALEGKNA